MPKGAEVKAENACWFSMCFSCRDLPDWFKAPESKSLQACIAAFEALAQLVLLLLRCENQEAVPENMTLRLAQLCHNQSVTYSTFRMLSMKQPLSFVLQALGFWCCRLRVALACSHIAGERNAWADSLSHGRMPAGFKVENRCSIDVRQVLQLPWQSSVAL